MAVFTIAPSLSPQPTAHHRNHLQKLALQQPAAMLQSLKAKSRKPI
jgi:hypothetical protein